MIYSTIYDYQLRESPIDTGWSAHRNAITFMRTLSKRGYVIIDGTWLNEDDVELITNYINDRHLNDTILAMSLFDPINEPLYDIINSDDIEPDIQFISNYQYTFWFHQCDRMFVDYTVSDLIPTGDDLEYQYLCYQRKPTYGRPELYNRINGKGYGIVTIGTEESNINVDIPEHIGLQEVAGDWGGKSPNDIYSLGNLDVWKRSFLNIVSETGQSQYEKEYVFVSEKMVKPILGFRPFIVFGNPDINDLLVNLGFELFNEDFHYNANSSLEDQIDGIDRLVNHLLPYLDIEQYYKKIFPKIEHNHNRFQDLIIEQNEYIEKLLIS